MTDACTDNFEKPVRINPLYVRGIPAIPRENTYGCQPEDTLLIRRKCKM